MVGTEKYIQNYMTLHPRAEEPGTVGKSQLKSTHGSRVSPDGSHFRHAHLFYRSQT
jgi:hypothetical protein